MPKAANHIHKYKKVDLARKKGTETYLVYKCQIPTCTHYTPISMAEGKICECSRCKGIMVITKVVLTHSGGKPMLYPHCPACTKRKKVDDVAALTDFLSKRV